MQLKFATWLRAYAIEHNDGVEHGAYTKLGKEIGVKPTTLRSILGRKGRCRDETRYLIGEKLGVDVDEIIGIKRVDDNGKPPLPPRIPTAAERMAGVGHYQGCNAGDEIIQACNDHVMVVAGLNWRRLYEVLRLMHEIAAEERSKKMPPPNGIDRRGGDAAEAGQ